MGESFLSLLLGVGECSFFDGWIFDWVELVVRHLVK